MTGRTRTLVAGALLLLLAAAALSGCGDRNDQTTAASNAVVNNANGNTTVDGNVDDGRNTAVDGDAGDGGNAAVGGKTGDGGNAAVGGESDDGGNVTDGKTDDSGNTTVDGQTGDSGNTTVGGKTGDSGNTTVGGKTVKTGNTAAQAAKPKIVAGNEAFRVYGPAPESIVGTRFTVKGQARVFEAAFGYSFEDGHNVLAEGHVMADKGAPEWGSFSFTVKLTMAPTSPTGVLTIYEASAKDGSHVHKLTIAYKFDEGILQLEPAT